ncbi:hypothetical protein AAU61_14550 [Desulfocarbo indianensis]|nr:hypothetical protein AAU61_14550 [Desulfocarbo indianensis]
MPACEKCQSDTPQDELREHTGLMLCEDCYMDALSPTRTCDPWATYTASRLTNQELSPGQESILLLLKKKGQASVQELLEGTGLEFRQLEKEIAALRHMELIRGALTPEKEKVFKLFDDRS